MLPKSLVQHQQPKLHPCLPWVEEEDEQNVEKDVENIRPNISVKRSELRVKEKNAQDKGRLLCF